jgi:hypothetical protein
MKNGCRVIAPGPPVAPAALRLPAPLLIACAVNSPVSNWTIAFCIDGVSGSSACA